MERKLSETILSGAGVPPAVLRGDICPKKTAGETPAPRKTSRTLPLGGVGMNFQREFGLIFRPAQNLRDFPQPTTDTQANPPQLEWQ
jgi:hypothetical protein